MKGIKEEFISMPLAEDNLVNRYQHGNTNRSTAPILDGSSNEYFAVLR
jgi:hypothetical protein